MAQARPLRGNRRTGGNRRLAPGNCRVHRGTPNPVMVRTPDMPGRRPAGDKGTRLAWQSAAQVRMVPVGMTRLLGNSREQWAVLAGSSAAVVAAAGYRRRHLVLTVVDRSSG